MQAEEEEEFCLDPCEAPQRRCSGAPPGLQLPGDIGQMQRDDPGLSKLFQKENDEDHNETDGKNGYVVKQGMLYWQRGAVQRLVVPQEACELFVWCSYSQVAVIHKSRVPTRNSDRSRHELCPHC